MSRCLGSCQKTRCSSVDRNLLLSVHVPGPAPFPSNMRLQSSSTKLHSAIVLPAESALPHRCEDSTREIPDTCLKGAQGHLQQCCRK